MERWQTFVREKTADRDEWPLASSGRDPPERSSLVVQKREPVVLKDLEIPLLKEQGDSECRTFQSTIQLAGLLPLFATFPKVLRKILTPNFHIRKGAKYLDDQK